MLMTMLEEGSGQTRRQFRSLATPRSELCIQLLSGVSREFRVQQRRPPVLLHLPHPAERCDVKLQYIFPHGTTQQHDSTCWTYDTVFV